MNTCIKRSIVTLTISLLILFSITPRVLNFPVAAARDSSGWEESLSPDPITVDELPCAVRIDGENYRSYRECDFPASRQAAEAGARIFLARYANALGMASQGDDLVLIEVKYGLASSHSRFQQVLDGYPVFGARVSVHQGPNGTVQTLHTNYYANLRAERRAAAPLSVAAAEIAGRTAAQVTSLRHPTRSRLVWFPRKDNGAVLAWEMTLFAGQPLGDFVTVVDAYTGEVLFQENRLAFDTGSGYAYVPNPYQTQGNNTGMNDNGDATSPILDAQRISVTLQGLDSGTGLLMGEYVDLATLNSTSLPDNDADEATRVYAYDRADGRFEQVVIYHSIDSIQRHFQALSFSDSNIPSNGIRDFPTLANAHWYDQDQSFYSTGDDAVHFGDGGVDDGEDADIIAHEYGHAVQHDQNASWGGGEMGAMGEGFGDYLAASFYLASGDPTFQAANGPCVGEWDATSYSGSNPPCLRRTDGTKIYPDDLTGSVHDDGEIWSRALWDFRLALGPSVDAIVLEHHFALPAGATMPTAALEVLQANQNLNGGANDAIIRQAFCDRGILSGADCVSPTSDFGLDAAPAELGVCVPDDAVYVVSVRSLNGFSSPVTLDASGHPAGTSASFDVNPITPAEPAATSTLTINGTGAAAVGSYTIDVVGIAPTSTHTSTVSLDLFDAVPGGAVLNSPPNGASNVSFVPAFTWVAAARAGSYYLEVASDSGFGNVVYSATVAGTNYTATTPLGSGETYYWRVTAENACGSGSTSGTFSFTTQSSSFVCNGAPVSFESGVPVDWTVVDNTGGAGIVWVTTDDPACGIGNLTNGSGVAACADSDAAGSGGTAYDTELVSPPFDLSSVTTATLDVAAYYDDLGAGNDLFEVDVWNSSSWDNLLAWDEDHEPEDIYLNLGAYVGQAGLQLRFRYSGNGYDWYAQVDDVSLGCSAVQLPSIILTKTVGTDPAVCAPTSVITLPTGGEATYCYKVKNTGAVTLTLHDLVDDQLGTILSGELVDLEPGVSAWVTRSATITQTTVNTATWTAYNPGSTAVVSSIDSATVIVPPYHIGYLLPDHVVYLPLVTRASSP